MKPQVAEIIGRTIKAVYILNADESPKEQVFLLFEDGTHYEFYGDSIGTTAGVQWGGAKAIEQYCAVNKRKLRFKADQAVKGPDLERMQEIWGKSE